MQLDPNGFAAALARERGFVVFCDFAALPLRGAYGKQTADFTLVSIEDRHLGRYSWSPSRWGYPRRRVSDGGAIFLHRQIMGCVPHDGLVVDHINRDKVDCRRENLRLVTQAQNAQNQGARPASTSKHRGVSYQRRTKKWVVNHGLKGKQHYAGSFDTEEEAAVAARAWRDEHMPYAGDTSQYRGVSWDGQRNCWKAQMKVQGRHFSARFPTEEEAADCARRWRAEHMSHAVD